MMGSFSMERLSAKVCENRESTSKRGLRTQATFLILSGCERI